MSGVTTDMLTTASQIFLHRAYPAGTESIPPAKRLYLDLPPGQELAGYHAEHPLPPSSFQVIKDAHGEVEGYSFRLGSAHFPHLKMKSLKRENRGDTLWIFAVDTHDAFSQESFLPPPDHPDAPVWLALQEKNQQLKQEVEKAWEQAGLMTFNALLRSGLTENENV